MKAFFDSSVLVAAFLGDHEHHDASLNAFLRYKRHEAGCAAHSLAEIYSTLTRLPGRHRLSGEQALLFLHDIRDRLTVIALDAEEYYAALEQAVALRVTGGTIYDALLAHCATKGRVDAIYTWNVKHFRQFGPEVVKRIKTP